MKYVLAFLALLNTSSNPAPVHIDAAQAFCMATAIYSEARGETMQGKIAVAFGIKNRIASKDFPDSICAVIYQTEPVEQFPDITKARPDYLSQQWKDSVEVAALVMAGYITDPTQGARFWYNPKKAEKPTWARTRVLAVIGNHTFYDLAERKGL